MFCTKCGTQIDDDSVFCTNCGAQVAIVQQQQIQQQQQPVMQQYQQPQSMLCCPNCHGTNVNVQIVEVGQMTTKKGNGLGGNVNNVARGATAIMTFGVSNLFWKKSRGTNKTKTVNATMGICQTCGCTFEIEAGQMGSAPSSIVR